MPKLNYDEVKFLLSEVGNAISSLDQDAACFGLGEVMQGQFNFLYSLEKKLMLEAACAE